MSDIVSPYQSPKVLNLLCLKFKCFYDIFGIKLSKGHREISKTVIPSERAVYLAMFCLFM